MIMDDLMNEVSGEVEEFKAGLRVLVVDDDLCCLKAVESMLQECKYNVTATTRPLEALKMLREDENRFDIVITYVSMPEMDGFRLLELIGIEMDIPVIMLTSHGETKDTMKGIQHGACDYLVKPVEMLELKNIWRHGIKRKHRSEKDKNNDNSKNSPNQADKQGSALPENPTTENTETAGQKRKGHNEEDENGKIETEDATPTTQKKSRVVWLPELHQKFLIAVNHLNIDKAAPKKILDLMNVEGLTRENVASHLQKYRLYMKRSEAVGNKQENSMQMKSMEGLGFQEARRFPTIPISSTSSSGLLSIYNCPPRLNMDENVPPALIHQNTSQYMHNSFGLTRKLANQRVLGKAPLKSESCGIGTSVASNVLDQQQAHLCKFPPTNLGSLEIQYHHATPTNNSRLYHARSLVSSPLTTVVRNTQPNFLVDFSCQEGLLDSVVQNVSCSKRPNGEEQKPILEHNPNNSALPLAEGIMDHNIGETINDPNSTVSLGQSAVDESLEETRMTFDPCSLLDIPADGIHPTNFDTYEDLPHPVDDKHKHIDGT